MVEKSESKVNYYNGSQVVRNEPGNAGIEAPGKILFAC